MRKTDNLIVRLFLALFVCMFVSACHHAEQVSTAKRERIQEVTFSCVAVTKTIQEGMETRFTDGDRIGVYAVLRKEGEVQPLLASGNHADNLPFRYVAGENRFVAESENIYLHRGGVLDVYAYYPYREVVLDALSLPHTVGIRQDNEKEYTESDLLTAMVKGYSNTSVPVALSFIHCMAQLEVHISKTELEIECLHIKNRRNQCRINLSTGNVMLEGKPESTFCFQKYEEAAESYFFRLLLPPQSIGESEELFSVEMKDGKTKSYRNGSHKVELEPGKITRYDMLLQSRITVIAGEGGTVQVSHPPEKEENVYIDGETITLQAVPSAGYIFSEWEENGKKISGENPYSFVVSESRTIHGLFKRSFIDITTSLESLNGGHPTLGLHEARISGGGSLIQGVQERLEVHPGEGFDFVRWEDGSTENPRFIPVTDDTHYKAYIRRKTYYGYTAVTGRGSVVYDGARNVLFGSTISMTAIPESGYRFVRWEDNSTNPKRTITDVRNTVNVHAFFENTTPTYCINCYIYGTEGGTVEGAGCGKPNGTYTLYARPNPGYSSSWSQRQVTVLNGDVNVEVRFYK